MMTGDEKWITYNNAKLKRSLMKAKRRKTYNIFPQAQHLKNAFSILNFPFINFLCFRKKSRSQLNYGKFIVGDSRFPPSKIGLNINLCSLCHIRVRIFRPSVCKSYITIRPRLQHQAQLCLIRYSNAQTVYQPLLHRESALITSTQ